MVASLVWGLAPVRAQDKPFTTLAPRRVRASRMTMPPKLDGLVDDPVWESVEPATGFIQQNPEEGRAPTEKTEVRLGYDDTNLYIGIICFDSRPNDIVVSQNKRDGSLTETDSVQVLLDTFHDKHNAFIFGTTPTGIEYDAQVSKGGQGDTSTRAAGATPGTAQAAGAASLNLNWDALWEVKSQITARGWEAEMAIPFKTLRYLPGKDRTWGLQIMRNLRRSNEQSFWSPISRAFDISQVDAAGDLDGLELTQHRSLQLVPYVLGGVEQDYTRATHPTKIQKQVGADAKYTLTPSVTMDLTVNTDFAQVEVDEQQINFTRFDLFFPEKRPFFLENSGIFDFGTPRETEIFFSRRIGIDPSGAMVPIDAGVRVSGNVGPFEIGALNMKTREVTGVTPANDFTVLRVKRDLPNRSSIGAIAVNRQTLTGGYAIAPFNRTFGVDQALGIGKYGNLQSFYAVTQTPGRSGSNYAYASGYKYDNSHHQITFTYKETAKNFDPEVGFLQRANYRRPTVAYRRTYYPRVGKIRSIFPHFQANRWYTIGLNQLESAYDHIDYSMNWQNGASLSLPWNRYFERLDKPFQVYTGVKIQPGRYPYSQFAPVYTTNQSATLWASVGLIVGNFYNGTQRQVNLTGSVRKGDKLTWSGSYVHNGFDLPAGTFATDLIGFRFNWSFTPKSYLQSFTQYNSAISQVSTNIRFALLSTSSNGLYVVYNTKQAAFDFTDPRGVNRLTQGRALILKYTYLFNF